MLAVKNRIKAYLKSPIPQIFLSWQFEAHLKVYGKFSGAEHILLQGMFWLNALRSQLC